MSEDIYIVLLEDRHTDPQMFPYKSLQGAMDKARAIVVDYAYDVEEWEGVEYDDNFLFSATLSCEGDNVSVWKRGLNE